MTKSKLPWFGIFLGVLLLWAFGGMIFGPLIEHEEDILDSRAFLAGCRADEMRIRQYLGGVESQRGILNFTKKEIVGEPAPPVVTWFLFWGRLKAIYHTINFPIGIHYTDSQLAQIKTALLCLPPPDGEDYASYCRHFHVAFYENGQLHVYHYIGKDARSQRENLCQLIGVSLADQ